MSLPDGPAVRSIDRYAFAFVTDLLDEGLDPVLDALVGDGFTAVAPAALYHHGRDILPHNPRRVVQFHDGGASNVDVSPPTGRGLRVPSTRLARSRPLTRIVERAGQHGLKVYSWIVLNHNTRVGSRYPGATVMNAFGDRIVHSLCPANPRVHDLAERVVRSIAREGVDGILVEAVGYGQLDHGFHHERSVAPTSAGLRFVLGICFCASCARSGADAGVDVTGLRRHVAALARRELAGGTEVGPAHREVIAGIAAGELGRYLEGRQRPVGELVGQVVEAAREEGVTRVTVLDPAGAILGYATGRPDPAVQAVELGWRTGLDVATVSNRGAVVGVLGYVADDARLSSELDAYRTRLGSHGTMDVVLRPMRPDVRRSRDLAAHVDSAIRAGAVGLGFYHFGLATRAAWSGVAQALAR